jgi:hypothetical protein
LSAASAETARPFKEKSNLRRNKMELSNHHFHDRFPFPQELPRNQVIWNQKRKVVQNRATQDYSGFNESQTVIDDRHWEKTARERHFVQTAPTAAFFLRPQQVDNQWRRPVRASNNSLIGSKINKNHKFLQVNSSFNDLKEFRKPLRE